MTHPPLTLKPPPGGCLSGDGKRAGGRKLIALFRTVRSPYSVGRWVTRITQPQNIMSMAYYIGYVEFSRLELVIADGGGVHPVQFSS